MYECKNLMGIGLEEMTAAYNAAFADYVVPLQKTPAEIEAHFAVAGVDYARSFGAFYKGKLVGFLINSIDTYRGGTAAFDVMTGTIREHRGKGLFSQLFAFTQASLKTAGINRYYLEVITANENACAIYRGKGGQVEREFTFLTGTIDDDRRLDASVAVEPLSARLGEDLCTYQPSFNDRMASLQRGAANYEVASMGSAAVVYSTKGRISQIKHHSADSEALCAILTKLATQFEGVDISNIPSTETALIQELLGLGYTVKVNQYEMCIPL